jgi:hypothetical protein
VVAPEVPTGGTVGQAILDDRPHSRVDDSVGVVAAGRGQIGHVGVEVLAAAGAVVLRVAEAEVTRPPGDEVPQIMEGPLGLAVAIGAVAAVRARSPLVIAAAVEDLGLGQVLNAGDAFGGVGAIDAGSWHRGSSW